MSAPLQSEICDLKSEIPSIRLLLVKDTVLGRAILHIEGDPTRDHTIAGSEPLVRARAAELFPGIPIAEPEFI